MVAHLARIGYAEADDAHASVNGGEADHVQPVVENAQPDESSLPVGSTHILPIDSGFPFEFVGTREGQSPLTGVSLALGRIELDFR
jgi:hypothetical protein